MNRYQKRVNKRLKARYDSAMRGGNYSEAYRLAKIIIRNDAEEPASWITTEGGHHVPLDDEGKALAGGGGTLKGKDFSGAKSESSSKPNDKSQKGTTVQKASQKLSSQLSDAIKSARSTNDKKYADAVKLTCASMPIGSTITSEGVTYTKTGYGEYEYEEKDGTKKSVKDYYITARAERGGEPIVVECSDKPYSKLERDAVLVNRRIENAYKTGNEDIIRSNLNDVAQSCPIGTKIRDGNSSSTSDTYYEYTKLGGGEFSETQYIKGKAVSRRTIERSQFVGMEANTKYGPTFNYSKVKDDKTS